MYTLDLARLATAAKSSVRPKTRATFSARSSVGYAHPSRVGAPQQSTRLVSYAGSGLVTVRAGAGSKMMMGSTPGFVRFYSTPAPVEEAVKTSVPDSFVASAIPTPPPLPVAEAPMMVGANEGFTKLIDPSHWTGVLDPIYWFVQGNFELVQSLSGLPWWSTILVTAALWRFVSFPFQVKQTQLTAKTQSIQPELDAIARKYMYSGATQKPGEKRVLGVSDTSIKMTQERNEIMKRHGVGMGKSLAMAVPQALLMISGFFVLRYVSNTPSAYLHQFFETGGVSWFTDLTAADPTFFWPLASALSTCALFAVTPMPHYSKKIILYIAGGLAAVSFGITYGFPVALHLFWSASSTFTLLSTTLLRQNSVRKLFGILPLNAAGAAAPAEAPKPILFDQPLSQRPKIERIVQTPQMDVGATGSTSSEAKKKKIRS